jgi:putative oxygen-independent coproporphyrinogen III oxidase
LVSTEKRYTANIRSLGVYVHFPYCLRKCPYCDFASFEDRQIDHAGYADAVIAELQHRAGAFETRQLSTVFFGGGTPSLWAAAELGRVLAAIRDMAAQQAAQVEVTVECNPSSLDHDKAMALVDVGVDRLSIGVQSLDARRLAFLGRLHDGGEALAAVSAAIASGVPRVSADLIYGVASDETHVQSPEAAASEVRQVAALGIGHVSAYGLTIEPNTRFGELARAGRLPQVGESVMAETFVAIGEALAERGFERYEISNFSQPGERSRHNVGYWRGDDYLGVGCAAFGALSHDDGSALRYRNPPNPEKYLEHAARRDWTPHERDELDGETRLRERIMLGLRLREGLDLETCAAELAVEPWPKTRRDAAQRLSERGRLVIEDGWLRIPPDAWLFADGTAADLF